MFIEHPVLADLLYTLMIVLLVIYLILIIKERRIKKVKTKINPEKEDNEFAAFRELFSQKDGAA